jgi:Ca-activated chloride channel homolog
MLMQSFIRVSTGRRFRVMRYITLLCAVCAIHVPLLGSGAAAFRVLVAVKGQSELSKQQLTATTDGQPAAVLDVVPAEKEPLVFAILLDVSGSSRATAAYAQQSVLDLFRRLSGGQSVAFYGEFSDEVYLPRKPATVDSITETFKEQGRFRGGTALYDALVKAGTLVNKTAGDTSKRRAVIVLTDGDDNASTASLEKAVTELQRESVPVFCIGLLGNKSTKKDIAGLRTISDATGGFAFLLSGPTDVGTLIAQLVQHQYWVSLARTSPADGKLHSVSIQAGESLHLYAPTATSGR